MANLTAKCDRNSNVELLRLLCMFLIVIRHLFKRGASVACNDDISNMDVFWGTFFDPFCFCAVNVFILISGYFGIKLKVNSFVNLYVRCAIYGLLCYCVHLYMNGGSLGRYGFTHNCLLALSNTRWFIQAYIGLLLFSPILNLCIKKIDRQTFVMFLILLTIANVYFGWFGNSNVNANGYNVVNFVYLYFIGRYIKIYNLTISKWKSLAIYVLCSLLLGVLSVTLSGDGYAYNIFHDKYNNPILIIESVALLCFFVSLNFKSNFINWLAKSSIAIYLIHSNPNIDESILYKFVRDNWLNWRGGRWSYLFVFAFVVVFGCIIVDKCMTIVIKPLSYLLNKIGDKIVLYVKAL